MTNKITRCSVYEVKVGYFEHGVYVTKEWKEPYNSMSELLDSIAGYVDLTVAPWIDIHIERFGSMKIARTTS